MKKYRFDILLIVQLAMLMSIGVVLKSTAIQTTLFRIGFWEIPLVLAGIIGGPIWGFAVSFGVDTIYFFTSKAPYYSFLMSLSTVIWGAFSFLTLKKGIFNLTRMIIFVIVTSITAFLLNSMQLFIVYGWGFLSGVPTRLISMVIKWPIIVFSVWIIVKRVLVLVEIPDRNTFTD